jgi:Protein of unknown function (DUF2637)
MNSPLESPAPRRSWARRLVNVLVAIAVIAVAAAAFVFSYEGVRAFALLGGMSAQLSRYYPGLFDAVLVIACIAAAMLHNGRWWARLWAWLVALVLLAAIGAADVSHAAGYTLRHRPTEAVVAGAPVVAVLLAFTLLLTLLHQSRTPAAAVVPADRGGRLATPATAEVPALPPAAPAALPAAAAPVASAAPAAGAPTVETPARTALPAGRPARAAAAPIALPAGPRADEPAEKPAPQPAEESADEPADEPTDREPTDGADLDGPVLESPLPRRRSSDYPVPGRSAASPSATPPDGLPVLRPVTEAEETEETEAEAEMAAVEPAPAPAPVEETSPAEELPSATPEPASAPEPAPPTAPVRALTVEPEPVASPAAAAEPARRAIRYANGVPGTAERPQAAPAEPEPEPAPPASSAEKWDADGGSPYAGLVYSARDDSSGEPRPQEIDEDAPPFATAPFAAIPRLNRVRSMPAPPADDEDEDE